MSNLNTPRLDDGAKLADAELDNVARMSWPARRTYAGCTGACNQGRLPCRAPDACGLPIAEPVYRRPRGISVYGVALAGTDATNYLVSGTGGTSADVTRLDSVTWVGGATGEWFNPANWAVTGNLSLTGVVPDLNNVRTVLVPSGAGGAAISFDDSVAGLSAGALSGIVLVDSITYQDSVALSNLNFKNGSLVVSNNATLGGFESAAGTTLTLGGTLGLYIATGATQTMAGLLNGAGSLSKAGARDQADVTRTENCNFHA